MNKRKTLKTRALWIASLIGSASTVNTVGGVWQNTTAADNIKYANGTGLNYSSSLHIAPPAPLSKY